MRVVVCLSTFCVLVAGLARPAGAESRVVVLGFSGPRAAEARSALLRTLGEEVELVELSEWRETAERIGERGRTSRALARVARELGVSAVVTGSVSRAPGRRFVLSVAVRHGSTGRIVDTVSRTMRTLGSLRGAAAGASDRVVELVRRAEPPGPGGGDLAPAGDAPEPAGGGTMDWSVGAEGEGGAPSGAGRTGVGVAQALDPELGGPGQAPRPRPGSDEPRREPGRGSPRGPRASGSGLLGEGGARSWLEVALEVPLAYRTFTLAINPAVDSVDGQPGRPGARVDSGLFGEIGMRLAFHPGAILSEAWWAGLGLEATFHYFLGLKIYRETAAGQPPAEIESSEYSLSLGATYRHVVGTETRGATIWGSVGYGRFAFLMGPENNDLVPPFVYDHVHLSLAAHVPLGSPHAGLDLAAGYLAVLGVGPEASATYNQSGTLPSSNGFRILAGLSGRIWAGLRWRLAFEMLGFVTEHAGVGRGYGTDPTTIGRGIETVEPTVDIFWRVVPQLAYRFGGAPSRGAPRAGRGHDGGSEDWFAGGQAESEPAELDAIAPGEEPEDEGWLTTD